MRVVEPTRRRAWRDPTAPPPTPAAPGSGNRRYPCASSADARRRRSAGAAPAPSSRNRETRAAGSSRTDEDGVALRLAERLRHLAEKMQLKLGIPEQHRLERLGRNAKHSQGRERLDGIDVASSARKPEDVIGKEKGHDASRFAGQRSERADGTGDDVKIAVAGSPRSKMVVPARTRSRVEIVARMSRSREARFLVPNRSAVSNAAGVIDGFAGALNGPRADVEPCSGTCFCSKSLSCSRWNGGRQDVDARRNSPATRRGSIAVFRGRRVAADPRFRRTGQPRGCMTSWHHTGSRVANRDDCRVTKERAEMKGLVTVLAVCASPASGCRAAPQ